MPSAPSDSILSADILGGTSLREAFDRVEAERAVDRCAKRIGMVAESFSGQPVRRDGDCLGFAFGTPTEAILAAFMMQERLALLPAIFGIRLGIGIGLCFPDAFAGGVPAGFECTDAARQLAGEAGCTEILLGLPARPELLSRLAALPVCDLRAPQPCGSVELAVVHLNWRAEQAPDAARQAGALVAGGPEFMLIQGHREFAVSRHRPTLSIGRDAGCQLVLTHIRCSRRHAQIEWRDGRILLTDRSTNGTYVRLDDGPEWKVHRSSVELRGSGRLRFGSPEAQSDEARFRC